MVCGPPTRLRVRRVAVVLTLLAIAAAAALTTGLASAASTVPVFPPEGWTGNCTHLEEFEVDDFPRRPEIDNKYLPIVPGIRTVFEGEVEGISHRVEFTVTDLTKVINGVRVLIVHDVDVANAGTPDEEVAERELSFWAQDDDDNVWNLGEYPEEFGGVDAAGNEIWAAPRTWIAGTGPPGLEAEAGIHMRSRPRVSTREYIQGFAPGTQPDQFFDCAKVMEKGGTVDVAAGTFSNTVVTHETNLAVEGDGVQSKTHAPWVGIVQIGAIDPGTLATGEVLDLVSRERLTPEDMDIVREAAMELDTRAYSEPNAMNAGYNLTTPAQQGGYEEDDDGDGIPDWDDRDERDGRHHRGQRHERERWSIAIGR